MGKAARAIIIEDGKMLVMRRQKQAAQYFTLVGGQVGAGETIERALLREVQEETGLVVTAGNLVYIEEHPAPYNDQYIYLCQVAPHADIAIQETSEEGMLNRLNYNTHTPLWIDARLFSGLPFRTPALQTAIATALSKGFPNQPIKLSETGSPQ